MPNDYDSIDEELVKEFNISETEEVVEEVEYTETDDETIEEGKVDDSEQEVANLESDDHEEEQESDEAEEEVANETDEEVVKPSKEEKKDYAFAQFRTENAQLKEERKQLEAVAQASGYSNVNDFLKDLNVASDVKQAQEKDIDPEVYKELMETKRKNQALEQQINEQKFNAQVQSLRTALDDTIKDLDLGSQEEGAKFIMERLADNNITPDELLSLQNPTLVIRGALIDKIQEKATQDQISKQAKLSKIADDKHTSTAPKKDLDLDSLIAREMKAYKEENYL